MKRRRRSGIDPTYFQNIRVGNVEIVEEQDKEEIFYEKGKSTKVKIVDDDTMILLGGEGEENAEINIGGARKIVRELRDKYAEVPTKDLTKDMKKKFKKVHELLSMLRDTPAYEYLHKMVVEEFHCKNDHHYRIGTVGAYFCECQAHSDFPGNKSCSLGCLLGMHPEGGCDGYYPCEYTCLIYNGDETFGVLNIAKDVNQAYVFVNHTFHFMGFTLNEVKSLRNMGVKEVKVVKHSEGLSYQEVSVDFVPVDKLCLVRTSSNGTKSSELSYATILLIIIVIIVIIALIYGGWYYYKNGGRFEIFRY